MVRIVFSGTYKGFSHWYASDLKYPPTGYPLFDDSIYKRLLDRRDWFVLTDWSDKMGYSFQPISVGDNMGVYFHKIMLLNDWYDREGFMMASLFLAKDEWLDGETIRRSLDGLVAQYKSLVFDKAEIEIDWSFVDRKAEELDQKVERDKPWGKLPFGDTSKGSALVRGVDDSEVYAYFTYPNPLKDEFSGYEQVFLTEELLSPDMADKDGGYSIIDKETVDILNPVYSIKPSYTPDGYVLSSWINKKRKKDLESEIAINGRFNCGEVSKPGFKSESVYIDNAVADEYDVIKVELPQLEEKTATVTLKVVDENQKPMDADDCTTKWMCDGLEAKPDIQQGWEFHFRGTQCEKEWKVIVNDKNRQYKPHTESLGCFEDRASVNKDIQLNPKEKYTIYTSVPEAYKKTVPEQKVVNEDEIDDEVEKIIEKLEKYGLVVHSIPMENVITINATQPVEWTIIPTHQLHGDDESERVTCSEDKLSEKVAEVKRKLDDGSILYNKRLENGTYIKNKRCVVTKGAKDFRDEDKHKYFIYVSFVENKDPKPHDTPSTSVVTHSVPVQRNTDSGTIDSVSSHSKNAVQDEEKNPPVPDKTKKTYYLLLDDESKGFPLFQEYVTPEEAKHPKNKNKRSFVIEGDMKDLVTYDRDKHRLVYKGELSDAPEPTKWEFAKIENRTYHFIVDPDDAPRWEANPKLDHKYKIEEKCVTRYYIRLDDDSKRFKLFTDYVTPEDAKNALNVLKESIKGLGREDKNEAEAIVTCLNDGDFDRAYKVLYNIKSKDGRVWRYFVLSMVDKIKNSYVIAGDKKDLVTYDKDAHLLVYEGDLGKAPNPAAKWEFAKRKDRLGNISYRFVCNPDEAPQWKENPDPQVKYIVQDKKERKLFYSIIILIAVAVVVGVGLLMKRYYDENGFPNWLNWLNHNNQEVVSSDNVFSKEDLDAMENFWKKYGKDTRYVGEEMFGKMDGFHDKIDSIVTNADKKAKAALVKDTTYKKFQELYNNQKYYLECDTSYNNKCLALLEIEIWDNNDSLRWNELQDPDWKEHAASQTVGDILDVYNKRSDEQLQEDVDIEEVQELDVDQTTELDEDDKLWKRKNRKYCIDDYDNYLNKYPKGKHCDSAMIMLRVMEVYYYKNNQLVREKALDAYKRYYGPGSQFYNHLADTVEYYRRFQSLSGGSGGNGSIVQPPKVVKIDEGKAMEETPPVKEETPPVKTTISSWGDLWEALNPNNIASLIQGWAIFQNYYDFKGVGSNQTTRDKLTQDLQTQAQAIVSLINSKKDVYKDSYQTAGTEGNDKTKIEKLIELLQN